MSLETSYLGLKLKNPIVPSASPLAKNLDNLKQMEDAGASAVVMNSLFEEQILSQSMEIDHYLNFGSDSFGEALSYFPEMDTYNSGPDEYLNRIRQAKESLHIPVIGSINGVSKGGWTQYAKSIEEAGADALELNIYYIPTDPSLTGVMVEDMYVDVIKDVKSHISIPLSVKCSPYFSSIPNMSLKMVEAGANGLVLFNRFYQPDIELETLEVKPSLVLSSNHDMRLPMRWIAILFDQVPTDFALTSGIHSYADVLKAIMVGANVTMMTSELLQNGIPRIKEILNDIMNWMYENEYESIQQMRGSMSFSNVAEPAAFERANYMKVLDSWKPDPNSVLKK